MHVLIGLFVLILSCGASFYFDQILGITLTTAAWWSWGACTGLVAEMIILAGGD